MSEAPRDGVWVVTAYRSGDQLVVPVSQGREPTLTIDGDHISGTMGVNRLVGRLEAGRVSGPLATTRMAGSPELMKQEEDLLAHLGDADAIEVVDDGMSLTGNGLKLIELRRSGTNDTDGSS